MNWKTVFAVVVGMILYEAFGKQLVNQLLGGIFGGSSGSSTT